MTTDENWCHPGLFCWHLMLESETGISHGPFSSLLTQLCLVGSVEAQCKSPRFQPAVWTIGSGVLQNT